MSTATDIPTINPQSSTAVPSSDAEKSVAQVFRYSAWVHVGEGAEECAHREDGACADEDHFHAWCRIPNELQIEDIRNRALAAKARRLRALRDEESDSYAVLEAAMETLLHDGDREALIDEILGKKWMDRRIDAMRDVEEQVGENGEDGPYAHIDADNARMRELRDMDPEARPQEEYDLLEKHLVAYAHAVDERHKEIERPERETLSALPMEELVEMVRRDRREAEASVAFQQVFSRMEWFVGTLKKQVRRPSAPDRYFTSIEDMEEAAPEIIEALRVAFTDLEMAFQRGQTGNS